MPKFILNSAVSARSKDGKLKILRRGNLIELSEEEAKLPRWKNKLTLFVKAKVTPIDKAKEAAAIEQSKAKKETQAAQRKDMIAENELAEEEAAKAAKEAAELAKKEDAKKAKAAKKD